MLTTLALLGVFMKFNICFSTHRAKPLKGTLIEVHHIGQIGDKSHNDPRYLSWLTNVENIRENFLTTLSPDYD